jgi:Tfp pilus assembly protein PilN
MQRASCLTEKQELEAMLFDPKIAGESQLADLQRLRNENEALKARINVLEE